MAGTVEYLCREKVEGGVTEETRLEAFQRGGAEDEGPWKPC